MQGVYQFLIQGCIVLQYRPHQSRLDILASEIWEKLRLPLLSKNLQAQQLDQILDLRAFIKPATQDCLIRNVRAPED